MVLAATIAGADDFVETTLWGTEHLAFLRRFYRYDSGIPSHDTLCDVFAALDPELFKSCFLAWINGLRDGDPDIIAVDGKTSRRSHDRRMGRYPLHLVSAWAARQRIVLGQQATEEKSNEITAIPLLLKHLDLKGALVTMDAMGTQTDIARAIRDGGGDYRMSLKKNWPAVHAEVEQFVHRSARRREVRNDGDRGPDGRAGRDPPAHGLSSGRLDDIGPALPGRTGVPGPGHDRADRNRGRAKRKDRARDTLLSVFDRSLCVDLRPCRAGALGSSVRPLDVQAIPCQPPRGPLRIRAKASIIGNHLGGSAMNRRPHRTGTNLSLSPATRGAHICVIGAGPSGLTTLKNLLALGLTNAVCFDSANAIGGNWVFREDQPSVHQFTHTISSKRLSEFEDYPMPADFPDFPSHCEVRAYLEAYAAHFGLAPFIRLNERIESATRRADGRWSVRIATPREIKEVDFDYLIVCSGHHRVALIPNYPGHFGGEVLHSGAFKQAAPFANKRVLVVGGGNSACDIASEISRVASRTCISMRRGSYILPKKMFGYPVDRLYASFRWLPQVISRPLFEAVLRMKVGRWRDYGLRAPRARLLEMHPTLNSNVLKALRSGAVVPRVGIARLAENEIEFLDGIVEAFDTVIWATGFRATFPFLDASVVDWNMAECPPLYLKMMHREAANLYFIGFFQPLGCIWRLADHQARIAALQIAGYLNRPADIVARIAREMGTRHRRFDQSTRHAIEVDSHEFRRELLAYIKTARIAPRDFHGSIWDQRGAPHQGSDIGKIVVRRSESSNATECNAESV